MLILLRCTIFAFCKLPVAITIHSASWPAKVVANCNFIVLGTWSRTFFRFPNSLPGTGSTSLYITCFRFTTLAFLRLSIRWSMKLCRLMLLPEHFLHRIHAFSAAMSSRFVRIEKGYRLFLL